MNSFFWLFLGAVGLFFVVPLNTNTDFYFASLDAASTALSTGFLVAFLPVVWDSFRVPPDLFNRSNALVLGIWTFLLGSATRYSMLWFYRVHGHPDWVLESRIMGLGLWLVVIGGITLMVADRNGPHNMPPKQWFGIGALIALAIGLTMGAFTWFKY